MRCAFVFAQLCMCLYMHLIVVSGKEASKENTKGCNPTESEEEHLFWDGLIRCEENARM